MDVNDWFIPPSVQYENESLLRTKPRDSDDFGHIPNEQEMTKYNSCIEAEKILVTVNNCGDEQGPSRCEQRCFDFNQVFPLGDDGVQR